MSERPHDDTLSDRRSTEETDLFAGLRAETRPGDPATYPTIPDVQVTGLLGAGGMGVVYRGKQTYLDRPVAVKVLRDTSQNFTARFRREAKILATMSHPNIVACYAAGTTAADQCYLVMEFIDGPNLQEWLERRGPLSPVHALAVCRDLAQALGHAYELHGIIHRDVKPENVLLKPRAGGSTDRKPPYEAKLADLGLARAESTDVHEGGTRAEQLTRPGSVMGSPATMSPEQFDDPDGVDYRTDVYGLGCVLYAALTGQKAFQGETLSATILQKRSKLGPDPSKVARSVPRELANLVQSMLAHDRTDRPQSYGELAERCERIMERLLGTPRRVRGGLGRVGVGLLVVVGLAVGVWAAFLRSTVVVRSAGAREGETLELAATTAADGGRWRTRVAAGGPTVGDPVGEGPRASILLPQARAPYAVAFDFARADARVVETVEVSVAAVDDPPRIAVLPGAEVAEGDEVVVEVIDPDTPFDPQASWTVAHRDGPPIAIPTRNPRIAFRAPHADAPYEFALAHPALETPVAFRVAAQDDPPRARIARTGGDPVREGERVELDGATSLASRDREDSAGEVAGHRWTVLSAPAGFALEGAQDAARNAFVAPRAAAPYEIGLRLTVRDEAGQEDATDLTIAVHADEEPPVARIDAPEDGWVEGARVRVSAAGSHDRLDRPGTDHLTYAWSVLRGPQHLVPDALRTRRDVELQLPVGLPLRDRALVLELAVHDGVTSARTEWSATIRSAIGALQAGRDEPVWDASGRSRFDASTDTEAWIHTGTCVQGIPAEGARTEYPLHLPEGSFELAGEVALIPLADKALERRGGLRFEFGDGAGVWFQLEPVDAEGRQHRARWFAVQRLVDGTWATKDPLPLAIPGGVTTVVSPLVRADRDQHLALRVRWTGDRFRFDLEWKGRDGERAGGIGGFVRPATEEGRWPWRLVLVAERGVFHVCDLRVGGL